MAKKKECIAMLLAGGQGSRLGALTKNIAKPAVSFGGKYRIIDFPLSNCTNSGIDTVGVLTQYRPLVLNSYIGTGRAWDLDGGVFILPPYATEKGGSWYNGTADAIYRNLDFIDNYDPDYVIILSGDHIYHMDYQAMLDVHKKNAADVTISVMPVPWEEAPRFGILTADESGRISKFTEKPKNPDSNLASMGIYIFTASKLKKYLLAECTIPNKEEHDFGKDIIPQMLGAGERMFVYEFKDFWKDVGTFDSYHEANMDLLDEEPAFNLFDPDHPVLSNSNIEPPMFVGANGNVEESLVANGSCILGDLQHSVLGMDCYIGEGAYVKDAVLLPGARVEAGAKVCRAILGEGAVVAAGAVFGSEDPAEPIAVIGNSAVFDGGAK
ncbi:MAG: glucose-1-phosphate adenylyltransferase [bacterium]